MSKIKILALSDTHGNIEKAKKAVLIEKPDIVFHLGDYVKDAKELKKQFSDLKFYIVSGNGDYFSMRDFKDKMIEIKGYKMFLTHGHKYSVKYTNSKITEKFLSLDCDYLFYGHTHYAKIMKMKNGYIVNPGSISIARGKNTSYCMLDIKEKEKNRIIEPVIKNI